MLCSNFCQTKNKGNHAECFQLVLLVLCLWLTTVIVFNYGILALVLVFWWTTSYEVVSLAQTESYKTVNPASCIDPWFVPNTNGTCHCGDSVKAAVVVQ